MSIFGNPKHPGIQSLLRFNSYLSLHPAAITLQCRPDVQPICTDRAVLGAQRGLNWSAAISNCCPEQQPPHLRIPPPSLPRNLPQTQPPRLTWPVIVSTGQCCPLPVWTPDLPTFPRATPLSVSSSTWKTILIPLPLATFSQSFQTWFRSPSPWNFIQLLQVSAIAWSYELLQSSECYFIVTDAVRILLTWRLPLYLVIRIFIPAHFSPSQILGSSETDACLQLPLALWRRLRCFTMLLSLPRHTGKPRPHLPLLGCWDRLSSNQENVCGRVTRLFKVLMRDFNPLFSFHRSQEGRDGGRDGGSLGPRSTAQRTRAQKATELRWTVMWARLNL